MLRALFSNTDDFGYIIHINAAPDDPLFQVDEVLICRSFRIDRSQYGNMSTSEIEEKLREAHGAYVRVFVSGHADINGNLEGTFDFGSGRILRILEEEQLQGEIHPLHCNAPCAQYQDIVVYPTELEHTGNLAHVVAIKNLKSEGLWGLCSDLSSLLSQVQHPLLIRLRDANNAFRSGLDAAQQLAAFSEEAVLSSAISSFERSIEKTLLHFFPVRALIPKSVLVMTDDQWGKANRSWMEVVNTQRPLGFTHSGRKGTWQRFCAGIFATAKNKWGDDSPRLMIQGSSIQGYKWIPSKNSGRVHFLRGVSDYDIGVVVSKSSIFNKIVKSCATKSYQRPSNLHITLRAWEFGLRGKDIEGVGLQRVNFRITDADYKIERHTAPYLQVIQKPDGHFESEVKNKDYRFERYFGQILEWKPPGNVNLLCKRIAAIVQEQKTRYFVVQIDIVGGHISPDEIDSELEKFTFGDYTSHFTQRSGDVTAVDVCFLKS